MSFHLQTIRICCLFVYLMCLQEGRTKQFNVYHRRDTEPKMDEGDPTKGLSDAEIDMALDDLSLADLKMLSQLIDKPDSPDYDYVDYDSRNYALGPPRDRTFDDNPIDDEINKNYYDDIDEPQKDTRNLRHFKIPRQSLLPFMEQTENQRTKRENGHEIKQATVDAEYIRQLENSFPRDQEQNNEEGGDKKEHIRVKRN